MSKSDVTVVRRLKIGSVTYYCSGGHMGLDTITSDPNKAAKCRVPAGPVGKTITIGDDRSCFMFHPVYRVKASVST